MLFWAFVFIAVWAIGLVFGWSLLASAAQQPPGPVPFDEELNSNNRRRYGTDG